MFTLKTRNIDTRQSFAQHLLSFSKHSLTLFVNPHTSEIIDFASFIMQLLTATNSAGDMMLCKRKISQQIIGTCQGTMGISGLRTCDVAPIELQGFLQV